MSISVPWRSFVALGDSNTEGLQDLDDQQKLRGWADRLAQELANQAGTKVNYANLAIRGRLLGQILDEQVEPALALQPDLVSLWGGGNDLLRFDADPDELATAMEAAVVRFRNAGIDVLIGTGVDPKGSPIVKLTRNRSAIYHLKLAGIAERHGAHLIDCWNFRPLLDWRMWHEDRLHLNAEGHHRVTQAALVALGLPPSDPNWREPLPPTPAMSRAEQRDWNYVWARDHLMPWLGRRIRRTSSGAGRQPKYATYVELSPTPASNANQSG